MNSSQTKKGLPAEIQMETLLMQNNEVERHVFEEMGKVLYLNDCYYIRYEESYEDHSVPVTVKLSADGIVSVIRRGETTTRLRFDVDQWTETNYRLPTGILPIQVRTKELKISYYDRPFAGRVVVQYGLYLGEEKLGDYQMRLRFTT